MSHLLTLLRYILFHHQTTTNGRKVGEGCSLRYILFHHQTTTPMLCACIVRVLRYILFHHQTTTVGKRPANRSMLRYILFHHQTTTLARFKAAMACCVISSFITKPQPSVPNLTTPPVALYPLSSPNHNCRPLSWVSLLLRYILFHHQTTTHEGYVS